MKLSINGQQLAATHSLSQILEILASHGVDTIELWPGNLTGGGDSSEARERYETRDVAAAAKLVQERGFTVACVTLGYWAAPLCFARGGGEAYTEALRGAVDAAVVFGARLVNCYNVGIPLSIWGDSVVPAAKYAAAYGITITVENEAHDESGLPHDVAALCERVNSPGFGTQYDPCNYYHAGVEPYPLAYEAIAKHIRYVHLKGGCQYQPGHRNTHKGTPMRDNADGFIGYLPLTEAAFPVEAIVRRLHRDGYRGYVTLEPHVSSEHVESFYAQEIPYVRSLLADLKNSA